MDEPVSINICDGEKDAIYEALLRAEQGQQVLWIENTVAEAQEKYRLLAAKALDLNVACGLLHSRFLKIDREIQEKQWVNLYGKTGAEQRSQQGRILVGTQVLEQSLDIDADFLITRFCPTDMLLQRLGRLWRHKTTERPMGTKCEAWLLAPALSFAVENPEKAFGKTAFVYSPYVLCRSLEIWVLLGKINLPGDIRELIEATYKQRVEQGKMLTWLHELEYGNRSSKGRKQLKQLALVGLSQGGTTLPESKASTRYNEQDNAEILILRSYQHSSDKRTTAVTFLNGKTVNIPKNGKCLSKKIWRDLSVQLMKNTIQVAEHLAPASASIKCTEWLKDYLYIGNRDDDESQLRVVTTDQSGCINALDTRLASDNYQLNYDSILGYQAEKNQKENY